MIIEYQTQNVRLHFKVVFFLPLKLRKYALMFLFKIRALQHVFYVFYCSLYQNLEIYNFLINSEWFWICFGYAQHNVDWSISCRVFCFHAFILVPKKKIYRQTNSTLFHEFLINIWHALLTSMTDSGSGRSR